MAILIESDMEDKYNFEVHLDQDYCRSTSEYTDWILDNHLAVDMHRISETSRLCPGVDGNEGICCI